MFFLFLFFTLFTLVTPQNTCSINALSPATTCVYCATAGSVTIGANTTTSSPTQVFNVGLYSATLNAGHPTPLPTTQTINYFNGSDIINIGSVGAGSIQTQTVEIGTTASDARFCNPRIGSGQAHTCIIGATTINSAQEFTLASRANNVYIASNLGTALWIGDGTTPNINIGKTTPTPSPQGLSLGIWSTAVAIATNTPSITIGSPTAAPGQTITIGQASNSIQIGTSQAPTSSITIGNTSPAGAPTLSTSSTISLKGRYHSVYSSNCRPNPSSSYAVLNCFTGTNGFYYNGYVTNAAITGTMAPTPAAPATSSPTATASPTSLPRSVSSGYDTVYNEWHPTEPGYYLITFSTRFIAAGRAEVKIVINGSLREGCIAWGPVSSEGGGSCSVIGQFDATGVAYYIYVVGLNMWIDNANPTDSAYQSRVNIVRVA